MQPTFNDPAPEPTTAPTPHEPAPKPFPIEGWLFIPLMIPVSSTVACVFAHSLMGAMISVAAAAAAAIVWPLIMAIVVWCRYIANSDTGGWSALTTLIRGWLVGGIIWLVLVLGSKVLIESLFAGS